MPGLALPRSGRSRCAAHIPSNRSAQVSRQVYTGEITILDHDTVELSNLHRQVLHTEGRVGMGKAESAKTALLQYVQPLLVYRLAKLTP